MGVITDILKEIPLSAVLKERLAEAELKMATLEKDNAILKDENAALKQKNTALNADLQQAKQEIANLAQRGPISPFPNALVDGRGTSA